MIRLDVANLSRAELEDKIIERCSAYGSVSNVTIVQDSPNYDFALAYVEMSKQDEASAVLRNLGDSLTGNAVLIRIEQE